jgi:hypothetical protein
MIEGALSRRHNYQDRRNKLADNGCRILDLGAMNVKDAESVRFNIVNDNKNRPVVLTLAAVSSMDGMRRHD